MPDRYDAGLLPRTHFRVPRVPPDFRALTLAVAGLLVYWIGGLILSKIFDRNDIAGAFLAAVSELFAGLPFIGTEFKSFLANVCGVDFTDYRTGDYGFWQILFGGVWFFAVWSFFGQAIHRITSLRIARDEGLSLAEALKFSWRNWRTVLLAPVIIAAAMGFFYLCNFLAGVVTSIPWLGGLAGIILIPLTIVSTLLMLLIGLGGIFGLPLIGAAAAWEVNGSLDAISRSFSYLFARPLQYFLNFFLIFLFTGIILLVGNAFVYALTSSVDAGTWSDVQSVMIDRPEGGAVDPTSEFSALDSDAKDYAVTLDAKTNLTGSSNLLGPPRQPDEAPRLGQPAREHSPYVRDFDAVIHAPGAFKLNAFLFWVFVNLVWLGVFGYAAYWVLGAASCVYADLRADVDGTEEDEIYLEDEGEAFEALAEGGAVTEGAVAVATAAAAEAAEAPQAADDEVGARDEEAAPDSEEE